jgi:Asp-tRNA(Asn)/Glu-tRNA(Gln) amidotransferase C subunit
MKLDRSQIEGLARIAGLQIPEDEIDQVARQLASLLTAMEEVEEKFGDLLDQVEPIPPVFPHEDFDTGD